MSQTNRAMATTRASIQVNSISPSMLTSPRVRSMVASWWSERHHSTERLTTITLGTSSSPRMAERLPRPSRSGVAARSPW